MEFTIDFPLHVKIEYPRDGKKQGIVLVWRRDDWLSCYYFYSVVPQDEEITPLWHFDSRYFRTEDGLVEAIKEHVTNDWRLTR